MRDDKDGYQLAREVLYLSPHLILNVKGGKSLDAYKPLIELTVTVELLFPSVVCDILGDVLIT